MTARACGLCAATVAHVGDHVRRDHRAELAHPLNARATDPRADFRGILAAYLAAAAIVATAALTALVR